MENASQALIIAGAILLAILLIAIGMFIFNKANTSIQDAAKGMDQNAIAVVNGKFTPYQGTISGTQLKALIGVWGQYITQMEADGAGREKFMGAKQTEGSTGSNAFLTALGSKFAYANNSTFTSSQVLGLTNQVKDLERYTVTFDYTSGLITQINIKLGN